MLLVQDARLSHLHTVVGESFSMSLMCILSEWQNKTNFWVIRNSNERLLQWRTHQMCEWNNWATLYSIQYTACDNSSVQFKVDLINGTIHHFKCSLINFRFVSLKKKSLILSNSFDAKFQSIRMASYRWVNLTLFTLYHWYVRRDRVACDQLARRKKGTEIKQKNFNKFYGKNETTIFRRNVCSAKLHFNYCSLLRPKTV